MSSSFSHVSKWLKRQKSSLGPTLQEHLSALVIQSSTKDSPTPDVIILGIGIPTYEFGRDTNIQSIAIQSFFSKCSFAQYSVLEDLFSSDINQSLEMS